MEPSKLVNVEEGNRKLAAQVFLRVFDSEDGRFILSWLSRYAALDGSYLEIENPSCAGKLTPITSDEIKTLEGRRHVVWLCERMRDYNLTEQERRGGG